MEENCILSLPQINCQEKVAEFLTLVTRGHSAVSLNKSKVMKIERENTYVL